jgi:GcrA cell cycle regulator
MWTDERIELLKKLWCDGFSAAHIAAELGGVTRSAVLGKVYRLGLSELPRLEREKPEKPEKQRRVVIAAEARIHGVKPRTVYDRINRGMSREEALLTPVRGHVAA